MRKNRYLSILSGLLMGFVGVGAAGADTATTTYFGLCDASAAIAVGTSEFVVASDEDNVLRTYRLDKTDAPVGELDLTDFLRAEGGSPEVDIEGAARVGDRIFWIGSHSANRRGKSRPDRRRFFATDVKVVGDVVTLVPVGEPYTGLVHDFARLPGLEGADIHAAAKIAPKEAGGLSIEGLGAGPDGTLLIGFRNPIVGGKALLVPLQNPDDVINGNKAVLGAPVWLSLDGRGVRSIEYAPALGSYLLVAGAAGNGGQFGLYQWSGAPAADATLMAGADLDGLQPEGLAIYPGGGRRVQVFSDDGTRPLAGDVCKDLPAASRRFRTRWVDLD